MNVEKFLSEKLRKFSLLDICLVRVVYLLIGLLVATSYTPLSNISSIFYFIMLVIAAIPLLAHFFATKGTFIVKAKEFINTNTPAYQVLLFFVSFFLGCALCVLIPAFEYVEWYYYVALIVIFAIKPITSNIYW